MLDEAGEAYERALALAPDYRLARLNYGCLLILQGRPARARQLAREALALPGASEIGSAGVCRRAGDHGQEPRRWNRRCAMRLPAARRRTSSPWRPRLRPVRGPSMRRLRLAIGECLRRWSGDPGDPLAHRYGPGSRSATCSRRIFPRTSAKTPWRREAPSISCEAAVRMRAMNCRGPSTTSCSMPHNYYGAIRHYRVPWRCGSQRSRARWSRWLRYWHAFLGSHRREIAPGELKVFPNSVIINPDVERTAPGLVEGTLEHVHAVCAAVPPGCRARRAGLLRHRRRSPFRRRQWSPGTLPDEPRAGGCRD